MSMFPRKFPKKIEFSGNFTKEFRFFSSKFKKIDFVRQLKKFSTFQAKIGHLRLFLGKLFYFSSEVTTFELEPCAAVNLQASPPPIFDDRRAAADNLSARHRYHFGVLNCVPFVMLLHDFATNGCLSAK